MHQDEPVDLAGGEDVTDAVARDDDDVAGDAACGDGRYGLLAANSADRA